MIMASGFTDQNSPKPVFQVGSPGDTGSVEMSDLVFQTIGPNPGAIMVEWNVAQTYPGSVGMWDVHWRIGGSNGTQLQSDTCSSRPNVTANANVNCEGAFLLLHVTQQASIYMENNWAWVADHELDLTDHHQLNIYNGRGILIESENGPVWMYGTSSEHSVLYNYQVQIPIFSPSCPGQSTNSPLRSPTQTTSSPAPSKPKPPTSKPTPPPVSPLPSNPPTPTPPSRPAPPQTATKPGLSASSTAQTSSPTAPGTTPSSTTTTRRAWTRRAASATSST